MVWRSLPFWSVIGAFAVFVSLVAGIYVSVGAAWSAARSLTHTTLELRVQGEGSRTVEVYLHHATCVVRAGQRVVVRNDPTSRAPAQIVADLRKGVFSTNISTGDGGSFFSTQAFRLEGGSVHFDGTTGDYVDVFDGGATKKSQLAGSIPCTKDTSGD
ncbi:hypothetical protein KNO15_21005 [Leifsonia shinshuensis]|uniref:hypothetical protein n=1 Tax=Leifsonia shinshuensis TaxID=150026 RepID=UPI001F50FA85|nr:hypothetical protein [Leifsonia shinshuensis]MCI0159188.1 hypothetical protein [Leifsonia shinshuensis]